MKTILMLRHAKSDWGQPNLADFDRILAPRGLEDAPRIGRVLARFNCVPDKILASPAQRAKQTAQLVAEACGYEQPIQWEKPFYGGDSQTLLRAARELPDNIERVLLVGHNPTMEETIAALLAGHQREDEIRLQVPTAGLACLDIPINEWPALQPGQAILRWFLIPKLIKAFT